MSDALAELVHVCKGKSEQKIREMAGGGGDGPIWQLELAGTPNYIRTIEK